MRSAGIRLWQCQKKATLVSPRNWKDILNGLYDIRRCREAPPSSSGREGSVSSYSPFHLTVGVSEQNPHRCRSIPIQCISKQKKLNNTEASLCKLKMFSGTFCWLQNQQKSIKKFPLVFVESNYHKHYKYSIGMNLENHSWNRAFQLFPPCYSPLQ